MTVIATQGRDPFTVLGIPARFDLDLQQVAERHRELSRALHPDRHVNAPAGERRQALSRAISVNEAFRTLKDPVTRAEALLEHLGVQTGEHAAPRASEALLFEMMEAREALGELKQAPNADKLARLREQFSIREQRVLQDLSGLFAAWPTAADAAQQAHAAQQKLGELRYIARLLGEITALEDD